MTWPNPPKPVRDFSGLRRLEAEGQAIGARIKVAIPSTWRFLLLMFEYEAGGTTWVSSLPVEDELAQWAEKTSGRIKEGGLDRPQVPYGVSLDEVREFGRNARVLLEDLRRRMPEGWGFALLAGRPGTMPLYGSTADRENMPTLLREFAARLRGGETRPPGVLGREN